jgi:hypothetical protein
MNCSLVEVCFGILLNCNFFFGCLYFVPLRMMTEEHFMVALYKFVSHFIKFVSQTSERPNCKKYLLSFVLSNERISSIYRVGYALVEIGT